MIANLPLTSPEFAAQYRAQGYWPDKTLYETFYEMVQRYPNKTAIIVGKNHYTYAEFNQLIENAAANLLALGLQSGDVIAGQLPNSAEIPLLHLASNMIGLLYIPLHDSWRDVELKHLLKISKVRLIVVPDIYRDFNHLGMIQAIAPDLPDLKHIYTIGSNLPSAANFTTLLRKSTLSHSELMAHRPDPDLPAATMLSGGTTSLSKISRFSSNDLLAMIGSCQQGAEFTANDIIAALAPAGTGATGYAYPILMPLLYGATSVILERWGDPAEAIDLIVNNHCTCAVGIPTQLAKMVPVLETLEPELFSGFRCFIYAGAPLPYETAIKVETIMGCAIQPLYGATDGGTPTSGSIHDPQQQRLSAVGKAMPGCETQIWDEQGNPQPVGTPGEVVWRCPHKSYGYLGDDNETAKAFTKDHFYKSGDVGQFDEDGFLRIVGRIKDMILRGGRNISPRTIEEALMKHPSVEEVAVAAMPDPLLGERACAFVKLRAGRSLNISEAIEFLKGESLAIFQLPERLEIMDELPKSTGGKIPKNKLTAMVTEKLKQEQALPS